MDDRHVVLLGQDSPEIQHLAIILQFINQASCQRVDLSAGAVANPLCFIVSDAFSGAEAATLCAQLRCQYQNVPVILLKTYQEVSKDDSILQLSMPFQQQQLQQLLETCRQVNHVKLVTTLQKPIEHILVGNSSEIERIRGQIYQVADRDINVMVRGESGVGKEIIARCLHYLSQRHASPFVPVNCCAIPSDLLESELFGHEKGAFTGALTTRKGRFELAMGGTLFLDEIGDMPMAMQVKLLRVLQERTFERVGSNKQIHTDCRIIAATHRNLEQAIEQGTFREDLYYRLNVYPIDVPPLRERRADIAPLVENIVGKVQKNTEHHMQVSDTAMRALEQYPWPGNVRELANLVERLLVASPDQVVELNQLPSKYRQGVRAEERQAIASSLKENFTPPPAPAVTPFQLPQSGFNLKQYLMQTEMSMIRQALEICDGVVAQAARYLNMRRTTLIEKMRKYNIHRPECEMQEI